MYFSKYFSSYKQANLVLLGATVLFGTLIYFASLKRTISNYSSYTQKKEQLKRVSNATQLIAQYQSKLVQFQQQTQQSYNRENLLEQITTYCRTNQLLVKTFPQAQRVKENNYPIITNQIQVEGGYQEIVKLVYLLEYEQRLGTVSALKFFTHRDRYKKKNFLRANIVLRNIES